MSSYRFAVASCRRALGRRGPALWPARFGCILLGLAFLPVSVRAGLPVIDQHPQAASVEVGSTVTFSVSATSDTPATYRWYHDDQPVPDGTSAALTLTNVQPSAAGSYRVAVTNVTGTVVSNVAALTGTGAAPAITVQPSAVKATSGQNATLSVTATGTGLTYQWRRFGHPISGATAATYTIAGAKRADEDWFDVVVYNGLSRTISEAARLSVIPTVSPGQMVMDPAFAPQIKVDGSIQAVVRQSDGRLIVGGWFTEIKGVRRNYLARLNVDGSVDTTFIPGEGFDGAIHRMVPLADGKILVGGSHDTFNRMGVEATVRLNADGTLDNTFAGLPPASGGIVVQPDGKILIAGWFWIDGEGTSNRVARYNADGTRDAGFQGGAGFNAAVRSIGLLPDGKILVGGDFTSYKGTPCDSLIRLNVDGTLDESFSATAVDGTVPAVLRLASGKLLVASNGTRKLMRLTASGERDVSFAAWEGIYAAPNTLIELSNGNVAISINGDTSGLICLDEGGGLVRSYDVPAKQFGIIKVAPDVVFAVGQFTRVGDTEVQNLVQIASNGALDAAVSAPVFLGGEATGTVVQPDGKIVAFGRFNRVNGVSVPGLARLNADGSLDTTFTAPDIMGVHDVLLQPDGKFIIAGLGIGSKTFDPATDVGVARLNADGSLDATFVSGLRRGLVSDVAALPGGGYACALYFEQKIYKISAAGAVDPGFSSPTFKQPIQQIVVQPDGKLVACTQNVLTATEKALVRLNKDGSLDTSFNVEDAFYQVSALALLPDGGLFVGGGVYSGTAGVRNSVAVAQRDGTINPSFILQQPKPTNSPRTVLEMDPSGGVYVGFGGSLLPRQSGDTNPSHWRSGIARATVTGLADPDFGLLGVTASEPNRILITDSGAMLVAVRAMSDVTRTQHGLARLIPAPITNDAFAAALPLAGDSGTLWTNNAKATTESGEPGDGGRSLWYTWTAPADGTLSLTVAGSDVQASVRIYTGSKVSSLRTISTGATPNFAGAVIAGEVYRIAISHWQGGAIQLGWSFAPAPAIENQPSPVVTSLGANTSFTVAATGVGTLLYQWYQDGMPIAGATGSTLNLTGVTLGNAGAYHVVVRNAGGSTASTKVTLGGSAAAPTVVTQPVSQLVTAGQNATFSVSATGSGTLTYQWQRNGVPIAGATNSAFTLNAVTGGDADWYDVHVYDGLSRAESKLARLSVAPAQKLQVLSVDKAYDLKLETEGTDIRAMKFTADGGYYVAGRFSTVGGTPRSGVARFLADGTLDSSFVPPEIDGAVSSLALLPDGKVMIGGAFTFVGNVPRRNIARLLANGALDTTFVPEPFESLNIGTVLALPDGSVLVANGRRGVDYLSLYLGETHNVRKLLPDGRLDSSFRNPVFERDFPGVSNVSGMVRQSSGKIVVVGNFTKVNGVRRPHAVRLNPDGTVDPSFKSGGNGQDWSSPTDIALLPDDKAVLVGNLFGGFGGTYGGMVRIDADGSADTTFGPVWMISWTVAVDPNGAILGSSGRGIYRYESSGVQDWSFYVSAPGQVCDVAPDSRFLAGGWRFSASGPVETSSSHVFRMPADVGSLARAADGGIYAAGGFTHCNGTPTLALLRLSAEGSVDSTFDPKITGTVATVLPQPDGKVLVFGTNLSAGGTLIGAGSVCRLNSDGTVDTGFLCTANVTSGVLLRGGRIAALTGSSAVILSATGAVEANFVFPSGLWVQNLITCGDGRVILGTSDNVFLRLNEDGTLDRSFESSNSEVTWPIAALEGGKLLTGTSSRGLLRLNADGSIDSSFQAPPLPHSIPPIPELDGALVVTGASVVRRLLPNGQMDPSFSVPGKLGDFVVLDNGAVLARGPVQLDSIPAGPTRFGLVRLTSRTGIALVTQPPAALTALSGQPLTLAANAVGAAEIKYQWYKGDQAIAGATSRQYIVDTSRAENAGSYHVRVSSGATHIESSPTVISITSSAPLFTGDAVTVVQSATSAFSIAAPLYAGTQPITYQWYFNDAAIEGQTSASLWRQSWSTTDSGTYTLRATNAAGTAVSGPVAVSIHADAPWVVRNPLPTFITPTRVQFIGGRFYALGRNGRLAVSSDGIGWKSIGLGAATNPVQKMAFGNGITVALATEGITYTSADAVSWVRHDIELENHDDKIRDMVFGAGRFVMIGKHGNVAGSLHSSDGVTWASPASVPVATDLGQIVYTGTRFVALGRDNAGAACVLASNDGISWSRLAATGLPAIDVETGSLAYGGGLLVAFDPVSGAFYRSSDALSWTRVLQGTSSTKRVWFENGHFVAAAGLNAFFRSTDGTNWQVAPFTVADINAGEGMSDYAYSAGRYVGLVSGTFPVTSTDGTTWAPYWPAYNWWAEASAANASAVIAVGYDGTAIRSDDAEAWSPVVVDPAGSVLRDVAASADMFVATSEVASYTSADGLTWSKAAYVGDKVLFGNGTFVAFDTSGAIRTSTNGTTWIPGTVAFGDRVNAATFGNGVFMVCTANGSVYTSADGIAWTEKATGKYLSSVAAGAGVFAGVSGQDVMTSPDGVVWTKQSGVQGSTVSFVGGRFHVFPDWALSTMGRGPATCMSSPDGSTWSSKWIGADLNGNVVDAVTFKGQIVTTGMFAMVLTHTLAPEIIAQPQSTTVGTGGSATFSATASGDGLSYQWYKNGTAIGGATRDTYTISNAAVDHAGTYSVVVTNAHGSATSVAGRLTVLGPPAARALINTSTRSAVASESTLETTFSIEGMMPKKMLVRFVGPALSAYGVPGVLADPRVEVYDQRGICVADNDDWGTAATVAQDSAAAVGAFALPAGSKDAALVATLPPGIYTAVGTGINGTGGIGLLEVYDADEIPRLVYLGTRGVAGTDASSLISGFVVTGTAPRRYLIRVLGPTLGAGACADPQLTLFNGTGSAIAQNDNWDASLAAVMERFGAQPLASGSKDAALLVQLSPGVYSIHTQPSGSASSGETLLEVFEADDARPEQMAPAIVARPRPAVLNAVGATAEFTVTTTARPEPTFVWRHNGVAIEGATGRTLTVASAQLGDAGLYTVEAKNAAGTATSLPAPLMFRPSTAYSASQVSRGYTGGWTVTVTNTIRYSGTPTNVTFKATLPAGWTYAYDNAATAASRPAAGAGNTVEWTWTTPQAGSTAFSYVLNVPADAIGEHDVSAWATVTVSGAVASMPASPTSLVLRPTVAHSSDIDGDYRIDLLELTRAVELYNTRNGSVRTGCYALATVVTEDGFVADPSRAGTATLARYHSADSNRDGSIDVFELTRVIELYNTRQGATRTGRYQVQGGTEDGFAPKP